MHREVNPLSELEHDHVPLSSLLGEVRDLVSLGKDACVEQQTELQDRIDRLKDTVMEHFGEEEEFVFPALVAVVPQVAARLENLSRAHDALCGLTLRMSELVHRASDALAGAFPQLEALVQRFDGAYGEHAQREQALFRELSASLTPEQRAALSAK